jgi:hypothetical protein
LDLFAITIPDDEHSETEARVLVVQTFGPLTGNRGRIRLISARRPTQTEDPDVQTYLAERAALKGIPLGEMVNPLLEQEIRIIESVR